MKNSLRRYVPLLILPFLLSCGGGGSDATSTNISVVSGGAQIVESKNYSLQAKSININSDDSLVKVKIKAAGMQFFGYNIFNIINDFTSLILPQSFAQVNINLTTTATAKIKNNAAELVSPIFETTVNGYILNTTGANGVIVGEDIQIGSIGTASVASVDGNKIYIKKRSNNIINENLNNINFKSTSGITGVINSVTKSPVKISFQCDKTSMPISVLVKSAWALDLNKKDMLVYMDFPNAVKAEYDELTEVFSKCEYSYDTGFFIVYGDGNTQGPIDSKVGADYGICTDLWSILGLKGDPPAFEIIPVGDLTKNLSNFPIVNGHTLNGYYSNLGSNFTPKSCGNIRTMQYGKDINPSYRNVKFNGEIIGSTLGPRNMKVAADKNNIYVFSAKISQSENYSYYIGNKYRYLTPVSCPIQRSAIDGSKTECINFLETPSDFNIANGNFSNSSGAGSIFIGGVGELIVAFQDYLPGNSGIFSAPGFYKITASVDNLILSNLKFNVTGFQNSDLFGAVPIADFSNFIGVSSPLHNVGNGGYQFISALIDKKSGSITNVCNNIIPGYNNAGCSNSEVIGNEVFGIVLCRWSLEIFNSSNDNVGGNSNCARQPLLSRVNLITGESKKYDFSLPKYGEWYPQQLRDIVYSKQLPNTKILWFKDRVLFRACRVSEGSNCLTPSWVSFDFNTEKTTLADSSLTDSIEPIKVFTALSWVLGTN